MFDFPCHLSTLPTYQVFLSFHGPKKQLKRKEKNKWSCGEEDKRYYHKDIICWVEKRRHLIQEVLILHSSYCITISQGGLICVCIYIYIKYNWFLNWQWLKSWLVLITLRRVEHVGNVEDLRNKTMASPKLFLSPACASTNQQLELRVHAYVDI